MAASVSETTAQPTTPNRPAPQRGALDAVICEARERRRAAAQEYCVLLVGDRPEDAERLRDVARELGRGVDDLAADQQLALALQGTEEELASLDDAADAFAAAKQEQRRVQAEVEAERARCEATCGRLIASADRAFHAARARVSRRSGLEGKRARLVDAWDQRIGLFALPAAAAGEVTRGQVLARCRVEYVTRRVRPEDGRSVQSCVDRALANTGFGPVQPGEWQGLFAELGQPFDAHAGC